MKANFETNQKMCSKCKKEKNISEFYNNASMYDGFSAWCKECDKVSHKMYYRNNTEKVISQIAKWQKENPEKYKIAVRKTMLRRKYKLSLDEYNDILAKQVYRCACCEDKLSNNSLDINIHHNHKTGKVVNVLCRSCNSAEGFIKTPERAYKLWKMMSSEN